MTTGFAKDDNWFAQDDPGFADQRSSLSRVNGYRTARDAMLAALVPDVIGQNITVTALTSITKDLSLRPSFSGVRNRIGDKDPDTNPLVGFAGLARFFPERRGGGLSTAANLSNTSLRADRCARRARTCRMRFRGTRD